MNAYVLSAGLVCFGLAVGHTTIGLRWVLPHLRAETLPSSRFGGGHMTATFLAVTWHVVGVLVAVGTLLAVLAGRTLTTDGVLAVRVVGSMFAGATLVVLWLGRGRPRRRATSTSGVLLARSRWTRVFVRSESAVPLPPQRPLPT